ncbi:uncharacterized protein LOC120340183 [Styela clava]
MAAVKAPKQWPLKKCETITSFETWRQNLLYTLALDNNFTPFLAPDVQWEKQTEANPLRGLTDDGEAVAEDRRKSAIQKNATLELMLGQIANYCPIMSRNTIVKNSTSLNCIWQALRMHFGFHTTGAHLLELANIKLEDGERAEDLYQRLVSFFEDNLATTNSSITHHGFVPTEDEDLTPTLENTIVNFWLSLLHQDLPMLVKQRYGTELRSRTLASIKPEISGALESLLDELASMEYAKVCRSLHSQKLNSKKDSYSRRNINIRQSCPLCKEGGRPFKHYLSRCPFLPDNDKQFMAKARMISTDHDDMDPLVDISSASSDCPEVCLAYDSKRMCGSSAGPRSPTTRHQTIKKID